MGGVSPYAAQIAAMSRFFRYWLLGSVLLGLVLSACSAPRELCAALACAAWLVLCIPAWQHYRQRQRCPALPSDAIWLAYASQGGQARQLAERSLAQLQAGGCRAVLVSLDRLRPQQLSQARQLLLLASTYGEGEAPDTAQRFAQQLDRQSRSLAGLEYAVLALGDRRYQHFCAFGRRLDQRLQQLGAQPLQACLDLDRGDPAVLRQWQQLLSRLAGHAPFSDWQAPDYQPVQLLQRHCLNPGSSASPAFQLRLQIPPGSHWQAGDILEVGPCHAPAQIDALLRQLGLDGEQVQADGHSLHWHLSRRQLPAPEQLADCRSPADLMALPRLAHRDYSLASLPADGCLELLVRLHQYGDGKLGCASGWLCRHAEVASLLDVRLRANPGFQLPPDSGPLILIGNGTGLAGLLAHLREREQRGQAGHWLLFGERQAAHDLFYAEQLQAWQRSGHLARLDLAFSRDQDSPMYVQHRLREAADDLRLWLQRGASLLVCGSLQGMGEEIEALLHGLLGDQQVQALRLAGRYRRDLY